MRFQTTRQLLHMARAANAVGAVVSADLILAHTVVSDDWPWTPLEAKDSLEALGGDVAAQLLYWRATLARVGFVDKCDGPPCFECVLHLTHAIL